MRKVAVIAGIFVALAAIAFLALSTPGEVVQGTRNQEKLRPNFVSEVDNHLKI